MLRHWKDSWKGRTQPRDSPNEGDSILGADAQSGLTSGPAGLTMPGRAAAIPPADALHAPASAAPPLGELENAEGSRPAKRRKLSLTEETEYAAGSISQRLPEIHGNVAEPFARLHQLPLSDDIHLILEQAKRENSKSLTFSSSIVVYYLNSHWRPAHTTRSVVPFMPRSIV